MERLVTAYQEDLLPLDELRRRMPELRAREQSMRAELQAILDHAADRMSFLRLAETLTAFLQRLYESSQSVEIGDRQKIVRLIVKDVLADSDAPLPSDEGESAWDADREHRGPTERERYGRNVIEVQAEATSFTAASFPAGRIRAEEACGGDCGEHEAEDEPQTRDREWLASIVSTKPNLAQSLTLRFHAC
jgi:hypothetical protein